MTATLKPKNDTERPVFPFTAIIGQEEMKLALILNVIDPRIGGVMIMGDRGTGKSTTIRAVADLLPAIQVVADDPFNSSTTDFELMSESVKNAVEKNEEGILHVIVNGNSYDPSLISKISLANSK